VAADLQKIYRAASRDEAELRLSEFAAKWDAKYPTSSQSWRRNWERLVPFLAYPEEIRRVIYTTNAVESVNMSVRKIIKNRGSFPTDESAVKLLYLALRNITRRWTMPIKDWRAALNRFAIIFEDRMPVF
jgi:putative transposase